MRYRELLDGPVDFGDAGFLARLDALSRARSDLDYDRVPLVLLGAGSVMAQSFVRYACERLNVIAVVDNLRDGQSLYGLPVIGDAALSQLLTKTPDAVGVICAGSEKPAKHFQAIWGAHPGPLLFYFEVMPKLGQTFSGNAMFTALQAFSDRDEVAAIHRLGQELFTDTESLRTLSALLAYRLTWDAAALDGIVRPHDQIYLDNALCPPSRDDVLVDGGAYDGDTVRAFFGHLGGPCRQVHAFELDPENFAALSEAFAATPLVTCHAAGLRSQADTVRFSATGAMGSRIDADGGIEVPVVALDALNLGEVTFVKLDIEGAEGPALEGMRRTIETYRPKLAISAYHTSDDLLRLSALVRDMRPDYRFELRHYSGMIWDTLLYAG